jgi:hypothetical protein
MMDLYLIGCWFISFVAINLPVMEQESARPPQKSVWASRSKYPSEERNRSASEASS